MKKLFDHLKKELHTKKIHLSYQRLKVLEYLAYHHCHPTTDQIFTSLQKIIPTLSKTTVYNSLRILEEAGLVRTISIDDNQNRYDIEVKPHGHFQCDSCGEIYNFSVDIDSLISDELHQFTVLKKNIFFRGICPKCMTDIKEKKTRRCSTWKK